MSFPLEGVVSKEINGSFKLQPQSCLTTPVQAIAMCENSQSSVEEVISIDDAAIGADQSSTYSTIPLSKKAIHQRDADENLFLRFLELDPPPESKTGNGTSITGAGGSGGSGGGGGTSASSSAFPITPKTDEQRRKSTYRPTSGRTPFTITKRLVRSADKGYGFSIVWTHPPRIEKVESGLSADRAGILPGDFVIFVDKHNVVTMPEIDILNLIRSQGNALTLEIFRRSGSSVKPSNGLKYRRSSFTISNNQMMVEQATSKQQQLQMLQTQQQQDQQLQQQQSAILEPRPSTACSNVSFSLETTKRRLNLPQVTFSKEVGSGVIV